MSGRFGKRFCDFCGVEFEPFRADERYHERACHDQYFIEERRRALALWRKYRDHVVVEDGEAEVA